MEGPLVPTPMTCFKDCRKSNIRTRPFDVPIAMTPEDLEISCGKEGKYS